MAVQEHAPKSDPDRSEDALHTLQKELTASISALARLNRIGSRLWGITNLHEGLEEILAGSIEVLRGDKGYVQLFDEERNALAIVSCATASEPIIFRRFARFRLRTTLPAAVHHAPVRGSSLMSRRRRALYPRAKRSAPPEFERSYPCHCSVVGRD